MYGEKYDILAPVMQMIIPHFYQKSSALKEELPKWNI